MKCRYENIVEGKARLGALSSVHSLTGYFSVSKTKLIHNVLYFIKQVHKRGTDQSKIAAIICKLS